MTDLDTHKMHHTTERISSLKRLDRVKEKNYPPQGYARAGKSTGTVSGDIQLEEGEDSFMIIRNMAKEEQDEEEQEEQEEQEEDKAQEKAKQEEYQDKRDEYQQDIAPGRMKDSAKDRTGKNRNEPGGEERPDEEKQSEVLGTGPPGSRTEFGTSEDKDFKQDQKDRYGDESLGSDEEQKSKGKENARGKQAEQAHGKEDD